MLVAFLVLLHCSLLYGKCPSGTISGLSSNECFKFSTPTTWRDARDSCAADGGTLAIVSNAFLDVMLASVPRDICKKGADDQYYWLGASVGLQGQYDREWKWVDGSPLSYTAWASGKPTSEIAAAFRRSESPSLSQTSAFYLCSRSTNQHSAAVSRDKRYRQRSLVQHGLQQGPAVHMQVQRGHHRQADASADTTSR